jgi:hypothetical protein
MFDGCLSGEPKYIIKMFFKIYIASKLCTHMVVFEHIFLTTHIVFYMYVVCKFGPIRA